jgi:hypothetical protein
MNSNAEIKLFPLISETDFYPLMKRYRTLFFKSFLLCGLILTVFSSSAQKNRKLPDWKKFLYKTYSKAFVNTESAKQTLDSLLSAATQQKNAERMAHTNEIIGLVQLFQNDSVNSSKLFEKSEKHFDLANDYISLGDYESRKALITMNKLKFKVAEHYFLRALDYFKKQPNTDYQAGLCNSIGNLYLLDNRQADAIKIFAYGLKLAEKSDNLNLLCACNLNLGVVLLSMNADDKTGYYLTRAKDYALQDKDSFAVANTLYYLSEYYQTRGEILKSTANARQRFNT